MAFFIVEESIKIAVAEDFNPRLLQSRTSHGKLGYVSCGEATFLMTYAKIGNMSHPLYDVVAFEIVGSYRLRVLFDDESEQTINFEPVLYGTMLRPLRDLKLFNQVRLDQEVCTLVWPNGADFDPWMLHEWDKLAAKLEEKAQNWEKEILSTL